MYWYYMSKELKHVVQNGLTADGAEVFVLQKKAWDRQKSLTAAILTFILSFGRPRTQPVAKWE